MKYSDLKNRIQTLRRFGYVRTVMGFYKRWRFSGNSFLGIELSTEEVLRMPDLEFSLMRKERRYREVLRASYRSREVFK